MDSLKKEIAYFKRHLKKSGVIARYTTTKIIASDGLLTIQQWYIHAVDGLERCENYAI